MILVTGATGHVGNVLVRKLVERGEHVRAMVLPGDNCISLEGLDVEYVEGNVLYPETLDRAMAGVDTVFHLVGIISIVPGAEVLMRKVNVEGVRNTAQAALRARVQRMVHVSSVHAFRREPHGVTMDERTPFEVEHPAGSYDRTKAEGTLALLDVVKQGLNAVVACPTGIIGPHDYLGSEMGQTIVKFARRKLHLLVKGAYDFVDVRDVANGLLLAAEKGRVGETYILSGTHVQITRLRDLVQELANVRSAKVILPFKLALAFAGLMQHVYRWTHTIPQYTPYSLHTIYDNAIFSCAKAQAELGYRVRSLRETVTDTLVWRKVWAGT
ncbi:MAG: NAD-dependent epimerase/dehydratase family protein [Anaerolineae bacterium]|nr:NAD-dependent epimerase/dehydratase family protein [Anaerolineae bacterium]